MKSTAKAAPRVRQKERQTRLLVGTEAETPAYEQSTSRQTARKYFTALLRAATTSGRTKCQAVKTLISVLWVRGTQPAAAAPDTRGTPGED